MDPCALSHLISGAASAIVHTMKQTLIAALLIAATGTVATADDHAPEEFDFAGLSSVEHGVVEALPPQYPAGLTEVFEHSINPQTDEQLVVRLEDGSAITLVQDGKRQFQDGDRVLVMFPDSEAVAVIPQSG
jgi:hypothetical protein